MKKIVGILAVAAMATAMFAADVSAQLQIDGDLMKYDGSFSAIKAKQYDPSGDSDYLWKLSVAGDKAGAEIWSWDFNGAVTSKKVWFKPVDSLKISVGNVGGESAIKPQFGWWAGAASNWGYGYQIDYAKDALSMTLALIPGTGEFPTDHGVGYWFNASETGYAKIGDFWFDAKYNTSVGTAQVYAAKGYRCDLTPHGVGNWDYDNLTVGALWGNMGYLQTGYFVNVNAGFGQTWWGNGDPNALKFYKVNAQIDGQYGFNGVLIQLDNVIRYQFDNKVFYGFGLKARYGIEAYTPYVEVNGYSVMNKNLDVKLGCTTSVGSCGIDLGVDFPIDWASGYSFSFSVPVQFNVAF